jgi:hypothetical protein
MLRLMFMRLTALVVLPVLLTGCAASGLDSRIEGGGGRLRHNLPDGR